MMVQGGVSFAYNPYHIYIYIYIYIYTRRVSPFELGFSIIIHKVMGKTIDKIVLALSDQPNLFS